MNVTKDLQEKRVDPGLIGALQAQQEQDSDMYVVLENIRTTYHSLPEKSPIRTSLAKQILTGKR
jgi:hypothetical protein